MALLLAPRRVRAQYVYSKDGLNTVTEEHPVLLTEAGCARRGR